MIKFTAHARERFVERGIAVEWIVKTIEQPDVADTDPQNPAVTRSFRFISEAGGKRLRVVHRADNGDRLVITVYFDVGIVP